MSDNGTSAVQSAKPRRLLRNIVCITCITFAVIVVLQTGIWRVVVPPPRYNIPEDATSDEHRAVTAAQDAARAVKGRFVEFDHPTIFRNQKGDYRVRGTVKNLLSSDKAVSVYEAIVDSKSFECIEFGFQ